MGTWLCGYRTDSILVGVLTWAFKHSSGGTAALLRNTNWTPCLFCKDLLDKAFITVKTPCNFLWGHVFISISIIQPSTCSFEISLIFGIETPRMDSIRLWIFLQQCNLHGAKLRQDWGPLWQQWLPIVHKGHFWEITIFFFLGEVLNS